MTSSAHPAGARRVVVLGATGRVGGAAVELALADGYDVLAVARRPEALQGRHERLRVVTGDTTDPESLTSALSGLPADSVVVMAVGADPLKASTLVGDTVANLVAVMPQVGLHRYVGVSGVAQMPATPLGRLTQAALRRAVKAAVDHQRAFDVLVGSDLDWVVAGCPYIKDGHPAGRAQEHTTRFPGGYRVIAPRDVAMFLVRHTHDRSRHREIIGLW